MRTFVLILLGGIAGGVLLMIGVALALAGAADLIAHAVRAVRP